MLNAQTSLLKWYSSQARLSLPWRTTTDIYHIYLSEIMLQQTQVSRVQAEYYPQFLQRFPTLLSLSQASLDDVYSLWSGLGYYRRAKSLHATAQLCPNGLPGSFNELLKLPGIGKYTASAICSFGYKQTLSVVDTNISRVLKRFFAKEIITDKEVWQLADNFLNTKQPTEHNLALMDLGATICTPKNPLCDSCPLAQWCQGKDEPSLYYKKKTMKYEDKKLVFGVCHKDGALAMVESKGMLELPTLEEFAQENFLGTYKHAITRFRIEVSLYLYDTEDENIRWIKRDSLKNAPISSLTQKAIQLYEKSLV